MKKIIKVLIIVLVLLVPTISKAEFSIWAPINPAFIGGNSMNGSWILQKEQATNEYTEDIGEKMGLMMHQLMGKIDDMTKNMTDALGNFDFTINMPVMYQVGSGNVGIFGNPTSMPTSQPSVLNNFNPHME